MNKRMEDIIEGKQQMTDTDLERARSAFRPESEAPADKEAEKLKRRRIEAQSKVNARIQQIGVELTDDTEKRKAMAQSRQERISTFIDRYFSEAGIWVEMSELIAKDDTSAAHYLFKEGNTLDIEFISKNIEAARVIAKIGSLDVLSKASVPLLRQALELAHRGGLAAKPFKERVVGKYLKLYEKDPEGMGKEIKEELNKYLERVEDVPDWYGKSEPREGDLDEELFREMASEDSEINKGQIRRLLLTEGSPPPPPEGRAFDYEGHIKSILENITSGQEFPYDILNEYLKLHGVSENEMQGLSVKKKWETARTILEEKGELPEHEAGEGAGAGETPPGEPPEGPPPPEDPTTPDPPEGDREHRISIDELRRELQLRTLTDEEIRRIYYGGEEVAEEFVFDLILGAGANPKGRFEFDLSMTYQMSEVEKILKYKETGKVGEEELGEILAHRFASNIEDYRSFHTANQIVFYASASLEEQLKVLTKVLSPEHLDILKEADYAPEAFQLYERMLYGIISDKMVEYKRLKDKAASGETLTDKEWRKMQRGAIIEPSDLIPSSPEWQKIYRKQRAGKLLTRKMEEIVRRARRDPAVERKIREKEREVRQRYQDMQERKPHAFDRYRETVEELETIKREDIEREQAEHDLAFLKEMRKEYASEIRRIMTEEGLDENASFSRAMELSSEDRETLNAGAFFSEYEADTLTELRTQARADLRREFAQRGFTAEELENKVNTALEREDYKIRRALLHARTFYITSVRLPSINANVGVMSEELSEPSLGAPLQEDLLRVLNYEAFMLHRFGYFSQKHTEDMAHVLQVMRFEKMAKDLGVLETREWKRASSMPAEEQEQLREKVGAMEKILKEKTGLEYDMLVRGHLTPIGGLFDDTGWRLGLSVLNKLRERVGLGASEKFAQGVRLINLGDEISNELMSIDRETIDEWMRSGDITKRARAQKLEEYVAVRYSNTPVDKKKASELKEALVDGFEYEDHRGRKHEITGIEIEKKKEAFQTIAQRTPTFITRMFPLQSQEIIRKNLIDSFEGEDWQRGWKQFEKALSLAESQATNEMLPEFQFRDLIEPYLQEGAVVEGVAQLNEAQKNACYSALSELQNYFGRGGSGEENLEYLAKFNFPLTLLTYDTPWKQVKFMEMGAGAAIDRRLGREIPTAAKGNGHLGHLITDPSPAEIGNLKEWVESYTKDIRGYKGPSTAETLGDFLQRLALDFNIHRYRRTWGWIPGWERAAVAYNWSKNPFVEKVLKSKTLEPIMSKIFPAPSKAVKYFGRLAPAWMEGEANWYVDSLQRAGTWVDQTDIPQQVKEDLNLLTSDIVVAFGREYMPKVVLLMAIIALADLLKD